LLKYNEEKLQLRTRKSLKCIKKQKYLSASNINAMLFSLIYFRLYDLNRSAGFVRLQQKYLFHPVENMLLENK